jgi:hypothetical protein
VLLEDFAHFTSQKIRFLASRPDDLPYHPDAQLSKASTVRMTRTFRLDLPLCREASKLLQLASVRTFQQHVRTTLNVQQASGFPSKIQLWEDRCNRPDELIHKASITFKIQTSGRQSAWSGRACIRYGNCLHLINRPDDHPLGPDARSLGMEIIYSGSATVWTTGHHRLEAAQNRKEFQ